MFIIYKCLSNVGIQPTNPNPSSAVTQYMASTPSQSKILDYHSLTITLFHTFAATLSVIILKIIGFSDSLILSIQLHTVTIKKKLKFLPVNNFGFTSWIVPFFSSLLCLEGKWPMKDYFLIKSRHVVIWSDSKDRADTVEYYRTEAYSSCL